MFTTKTRIALFMTLCAAPAATRTAAAKETNRQVMDRYFEAVDSKKVDRLDTVDAADLEMTTPMGATKGIDGHKQMVKGFATAFPNFKHAVTRCVESGDTISCEGTFTGDHTGPMGMPGGKTVPATGKHVQFPWLGISTIKAGKVSSVHVYFDTMTLMMQLGLVPAPGAK